MIEKVLRYQPHVLVVDDDENIISAFEDFFKRERCTMVAASSSEAAMKIVERGGVDLLITDIRLQFQSGVALFLQAKSIRDNLPVIVITGYPESITEEEVKALGAEFMLVKPLDLTKLRQAVRFCLRSVENHALDNER